MLRVAFLISVHNRREDTLAFLDVCYREIDHLKAEEKYSFDIYLVEDGCTDGTFDAVSEKYPQVHLIRGSGELYWNQGMRLAWSEAAKEDYDFYLWLNVDTILVEGALAILMETSEYVRHRAIVVGTVKFTSLSLSYGGRTRSGKIVSPDPVIPVPCYTFNGNLVLVPKAVYSVLGNLEERYHHGFGDYDYGARAAKADIPRVVAPGILATCDRDNPIPKWRDSSYPLRERVRYLTSPKGRPPAEQFLYDCRSHGFFYALWDMVSINFKVLFPKSAQKS